MLPEEILFVFGSARGGTTFVNNLLAEWFEYTMGPEGTFVLRLHARLPSYGPLDQDSNLHRLLKDVESCEMLEIMRLRWPVELRIDVTAESILRHLPERTFAGVVYATLCAIRVLRRRRYLGLKNPDYWKDLEVIESLFPNRARYLFVVRDGRDVALSNYEISWGQKNAYSCARQWMSMTDRVESFARTLSGERLLAIRYEDFLTDPGSAIDRLQAFLAVSLDEESRHRIVSTLETNPLRHNYRKWATGMNVTDRRIYEAIAATKLRQYGYETSVAGATVSWPERLWYVLQEFLRKCWLTLRQPIRLGSDR